MGETPSGLAVAAIVSHIDARRGFAGNNASLMLEFRLPATSS